MNVMSRGISPQRLMKQKFVNDSELGLCVMVSFDPKWTATLVHNLANLHIVPALCFIH